MHKNGYLCIQRLLLNADNIVFPRPHLNITDTDLSLFDLKDFGKCTDVMLKVFIRLRKYTCLKKCIDTNFVWPKKKEKVNDSYNGVQNMITMAHGLRSNIFYLYR